MSLLHANLFSQLLQLIPRNDFDRLVARRKAEARSKGFSSWDHFVAMLFCQVGQAHSLREIDMGLRSCMGKLVHLGVTGAPRRSTLAYANEHRPWQLFEDVFNLLLAQAQSLCTGKKKIRLKSKLYSMDATVIDLCLESFNWARFRRAKGAVKIHMVLDHEGHLPAFCCITDGKTHEVSMAHRLSLPPDSFVVMDKAYNDYALFGCWCDRGIRFVTRMKDNAVYEAIETRPSTNEKIRSDEMILLTGTRAPERCAHILRRIVYWDEKGEREFVFLTNDMNLAAITLARIYKERWQIETFFKAIKQNLHIKTFVGTSINAVKTQIWTALIALLLLKILQLRSKMAWSLSNLVVILRLNLFTYRDLWKWIDSPFEVLPQPFYAPQPTFDFG